jgi:hypothetical protein
MSTWAILATVKNREYFLYQISRLGHLHTRAFYWTTNIGKSIRFESQQETLKFVSHFEVNRNHKPIKEFTLGIRKIDGV